MPASDPELRASPLGERLDIIAQRLATVLSDSRTFKNPAYGVWHGRNLLQLQPIVESIDGTTAEPFKQEYRAMCESAIDFMRFYRSAERAHEAGYTHDGEILDSCDGWPPKASRWSEDETELRERLMRFGHCAYTLTRSFRALDVVHPKKFLGIIPLPRL